MRPLAFSALATIVVVIAFSGICSCENPSAIDEDPLIVVPSGGSNVTDSTANGTDSLIISNDSIVSDTDSTSTGTADDISGTDSIANGTTGGASDTGGTENVAAITVSEALKLYNAENAISTTICGYIVGSITSTSISSATFEGPHKESNLLIADSPTIKDITQCIPVELKNGSATRKALNLVDNPTMLGQKVTLTGSLEKYFRVAGLKSAKLVTPK